MRDVFGPAPVKVNHRNLCSFRRQHHTNGFANP
jgi:hypothetical protein